MLISGPRPVLSADYLALDALARQHRRALLGYFRRKGFSPPDDEDAVQEVLIRLSSRKGLATQVGQMEGYLFAAAANVATDLRRRGQVRAEGRHQEYDEAQHAESDHSPEDILQGRETLAIVVLALKELPERTRTIFILARLEHMRQAEIARRLAISLNAVEKHIHKAVAYLAARIGRRL